MKRKADYILDFRGTISPISLLKMCQTFREMQSNEILEILGSDADTRTDVFKVLPADSYDVIFMDVVEEADYFYCIQLKKKS